MQSFWLYSGAEFKDNFDAVFAAVENHDAEYHITREGVERPVAVLISYERWERIRHRLASYVPPAPQHD